jgi:actin-related protein
MDSFAILDNGGDRIKYGWSKQAKPNSMPNCLAKINKSMQSFLGDEIDAIQNTSQLCVHRPIDRGYLVNWSLEKDVMSTSTSSSSLLRHVLSSHQILQRVFDSNHMDASPAKTNLVFTVPPFCPEEIQMDTNEACLYLSRPLLLSPFARSSSKSLDSPQHCVDPPPGFLLTNISPLLPLRPSRLCITRIISTTTPS